MKSIRVILILFCILFLVGEASAATYFVTNSPGNMASVSYTYSVNLSNTSGTNNATHIYTAGHTLPNFTDVYFTDASNNLLNFWVEPYTGRAWVNRTANTSITMWYGNASRTTSTGNPNTTFLAWAGTNSSEFLQPVQNRITNIAWDAVAYVANVNSNIWWGMATSQADAPTDGQFVKQVGTSYYGITYNNSVSSSVTTPGYLTTGATYRYQFTRNTTAFQAAINDTLFMTPITTNLPDAPLGIGMNFADANGATQHFSFLRYYYAGVYLSTWSSEQQINYIPIVASDTLRYSNNTENSTNSVTPVLVSSIPITESYSGSWRIYFEVKCIGSACSGSIYKNGVIYGNINAPAFTGAYNTSTQDFTGINIISGDTMQIYANVTGGLALAQNFRISFDYDPANYTPTLLTPANNSIISFAFPPQVSDVTFTWSSIGTSGYQFQVAEDAAFNLLEYDITTTAATTTKAMDAGTHYWRVRTANSGVYGNWSSTFSFLMSESTPALTGAAIQGVVYFLSGGAPTPLSGATVYLSNSTFTTQTTTGSNGYFLFTGLENLSVYNMKASLKDYQTSEIAIINVTGVMTYNIQLKPAEPLWFPADKDYVLFKARWLFCWSDCDVAGATITIYNYGESTPAVIGGETNPKTTDSTGSASFLLFKTQRYRITIVDATQGINQEMTIYPRDTYYLWMITNDDDAFQDHDILERDAIHINVTKTINNSTNASIIVTYTDDLSGTSNLSFFLNQTNSSLASYTTTGNGTYTFNVTNYQGKSYFVHILANHSTYGLIDNTYSVFFEKTSVGVSGIPQALWLWVAVGISFFVAALFTSSTAEQGLVILCGLNWIFLAFGAYGSINTTRFGIALTLVSVIAIFAYAKKQQTKEGYT